MLKRRFLRTVPKCEGRYLNLFNKCAEYESELDKDFGQFTLEEYYTHIKNMAYKTYPSIESMINLYKKYIDWYILKIEKTDRKNTIKEIDICSVLNRKYVAREKLIEELSCIPNARERFAILATYEGIGVRDKKVVAYITFNHVNHYSNYISYFDDKYYVSDELMEIINDAEDETEVFNFSDLNTKHKLKDSSYIFKPSFNSVRERSLKSRMDIIYRGIRNGLDITNSLKDFTLRDIIESGRINYILTESKKLNLTPREFVKRNKNNIEYLYGTFQPYLLFKEYANYIN